MKYLIAVKILETADVFEFESVEERTDFIDELHQFEGIEYALSEVE